MAAAGWIAEIRPGEGAVVLVSAPPPGPDSGGDLFADDRVGQLVEQGCAPARAARGGGVDDLHRAQDLVQGRGGFARLNARWKLNCVHLCTPLSRCRYDRTPRGQGRIYAQIRSSSVSFFTTANFSTA